MYSIWLKCNHFGITIVLSLLAKGGVRQIWKRPKASISKTLASLRAYYWIESIAFLLQQISSLPDAIWPAHLFALQKILYLYLDLGLGLHFTLIQACDYLWCLHVSGVVCTVALGWNDCNLFL